MAKKKSYREQNKESSKRKKSGQPRIWEKEEDFYGDLQDFVDHIKDIDYTTIPSLSSFRLWLRDCKGLDINIRTVSLTLNEYYQNGKSDWYQMLSDCLNEGAMLGKYQPATTIFALKNWCKWTDKQEIQADTTIKIELDSSLEDWAK